MASSNHSRKSSSRAALPRRTTKGPLDAVDNPLSASDLLGTASPNSSVLADRTLSSQNETAELDRQRISDPPASIQQTQSSRPVEVEEQAEERDLSFLLDASIYHPLSQLEVPGPFRKPFLPPPSDETNIARSLQQLDALLSQCEFLRAAQLAGSILTSGTVRSTDCKTVFQLLAVRYSCLELSGNLLLAAQEAKALEDLSSAFYYDDSNPEKGQSEDTDAPRKVPQHVMPFSLRLQALRLQSIGFSDPRRGVSTLYDTALECRENLSASDTSPEQRVLWTKRLQEVSIRVVNALIEMGDLDCAARTLETLIPSKSEDLTLWTSRMVLLRIKMGDIARAQKLIETSGLNSQDKLALESLLAIAQGQYKDAAETLSQSETEADAAIKALVKQNLAVAYLYNGEVHRSRQILEGLVEEGHSFQSLTLNLATIYDLSSDKSRDMKISLISRVANHRNSTGISRSFMNADFKL